jgi:hypothetical protein
MRKWILASQAEKMGRLYWSTQRGWTYKELASIYREPTRETLPRNPTGEDTTVWFEVEVDFRGIITVLDAPQERSQITDLSNLWRDQAIPSRTFTVRGMPNCVQIHPGYSVKIYLKEAS